MAILWCGGEDIDFPNGSSPTVNTSGGRFRTLFARCDVTVPGAQTAKSVTFPGGQVTSCWLTFYLCVTGAGGTSKRWLGLIQSGGVSGLWIGTSAASSTRLALIKYDGTTQTELAAESGNSVPTSGGVNAKVDIQLVNYGASSTVNVYLSGIQLISYSGSTAITGVTGFDQIAMFGDGASFGQAFSEFILADEDTRGFPGLMTMALTGAGTTDSWTGIFSTINQTVISDTTPNFTNTVTQDQQFNITDLTAGTFVIKAVKIAARMAVSATPTATQVKLGYNSGGSVAFGTGATKTPTTAYTTYDQLDATNPVTAAAWAQSDMNALQLDMRSA
jgi:hypothetical protein